MTREALEAFTQRLVAEFTPGHVIRFGSMARSCARWGCDVDLLAVMPLKQSSFEGSLVMLDVVTTIGRPWLI